MQENTIIIIEPQTPQEFEAYFLLRYEILRKPWNQPFGSEKDEQENQCIHAMAYDKKNKNIIGICRLQFNSTSEAQVRYMGVKENEQGFGVGKKMLAYLEHKAQQNGANKLILHARENAIDFYKKCGFSIVKKSYLMWEEIQHFLMEKSI